MSRSFSPETINPGSRATLGGYQSAWVIDMKIERVPFLFHLGNNYEAECEDGQEGGGNKRKAQPGRLPLLYQKRVSFTVTMIFVNGPRVSAYCDATTQNKNLITLQKKPLF